MEALKCYVFIFIIQCCILTQKSAAISRQKIKRVNESDETKESLIFQNRKTVETERNKFRNNYVTKNDSKKRNIGKMREEISTENFKNSKRRRKNLEKPNFIIMLMDDMGWGDLGVNGEPNRETPNIDKMAADGMIVKNMYASSPLCSPSRASLLTGRLPLRNGFYSDNKAGRNAYTPQEIMGGIPKTELLLSEILGQHNYTNVLIGKWHLGHRANYMPMKRGFHQTFGSTNCHFGPYDNENTPNIPFFRNDKMIGRYYEDVKINKKTGESGLNKMYTEEAVNFIKSRNNESGPFFMLWAPDSTHAPTLSSRNFRHKTRRGRYGAAVMELDRGVGAILEELRQSGLAESTLIIFTSDNGAALVSKYDGGSNGPFLCGKQTTFEGGMRVPGIAYWPGTIPPNSFSNQVWTHMDFLPTFSKLSKSEHEIQQLDGLDLSDSIFSSNFEVKRSVFFYRGNRLMAIRHGKYKMHLWTWNTTPEELQKGIDYCPGQRSENITSSIPYDHTENPVLYNIEVDPGERYPILSYTDEYKTTVKFLNELVDSHERTLVPAAPQLNWCDRAVMHWAPPGCERLNRCLPTPKSKPYKCVWPH